MKTSLKLLFCILAVSLAVNSCSIKKQLSKFKKDTSKLTKTTVSSKRVGDSLLVIPNYTFKDTTIYTYNRVGSSLVTRYNNQGLIDSVKCITSAINETKEVTEELREFLKHKNKDKETKYSVWLFVYLFGFFIAILIGVFLFFSSKIKRIQQLIPSVNKALFL